jgi:hypothetical protein
MSELPPVKKIEGTNVESVVGAAGDELEHDETISARTTIDKQDSRIRVWRAGSLPNARSILPRRINMLRHPPVAILSRF